MSIKMLVGPLGPKRMLGPKPIKVKNNWDSNNLDPKKY